MHPLTLKGGAFVLKFGSFAKKTEPKRLCFYNLRKTGFIQLLLSRSSSDLETTDFAFPQDAVAGLCADAEYFAHLLNAHHIWIVFQHELVGIALRNG